MSNRIILKTFFKIQLRPESIKNQESRNAQIFILIKLISFIMKLYNFYILK